MQLLETCRTMIAQCLTEYDLYIDKVTELSKKEVENLLEKVQTVIAQRKEEGKEIAEIKKRLEDRSRKLTHLTQVIDTNIKRAKQAISDSTKQLTSKREVHGMAIDALQYEV